MIFAVHKSLFVACLFFLALFSVVILLLVYGWQTDEFVIPEIDARYLDTSLPTEVRIKSLLASMTQKEKIGQMALVEKNSLVSITDITSYGLGGLLSGSGSKPELNTVEGWYTMVSEFQREAATARLGIPLLYGSDAIHGHAHMEGATVFPHAIGLGATGDAELVEKLAAATALELKAAGVNWNFAPNLDQPSDIRWGRIYEAFSDDLLLVSELGTAYLKGLQTPGLTNSERTNKTERLEVLGTLKHYLGLGDMKWNSSLNKNFRIDQGVTVADEVALRERYLPPFEATVEAGALVVMVGLNTWGDERLVKNTYLITDVLKDELGFTGFVVSDWYGVHEGRKNRFMATIEAINAGIDMVMLPYDYQNFVRHLMWANRLGLVSDERIDDAVRRILRAKFALGLFDEPQKPINTEIVGSPAHRALAREAVAKSAVLLKNEANVLPIQSVVKTIRVAGSAADNVGKQSGAWTIEWQGIDGNWLPGATSILSGIKARVGDDVLLEYDVQGNFKDPNAKAELGIAVVGEKPYAEGWGDREYPVLSNEDLVAIERLQASSEHVVVIIISGRPLLIANEVDSWDALVAAWLPGSEGAGVSDVLFGDTPFSGRLPLPWPNHAEQLPITAGGVTADQTPLLYPRGFGL